jgi:hypothetical protein
VDMRGNVGVRACVGLVSGGMWRCVCDGGRPAWTSRRRGT